MTYKNFKQITLDTKGEIVGKASDIICRVTRLTGLKETDTSFLITNFREITSGTVENLVVLFVTPASFYTKTEIFSIGDYIRCYDEVFRIISKAGYIYGLSSPVSSSLFNRDETISTVNSTGVYTARKESLEAGTYLVYLELQEYKDTTVFSVDFSNEAIDLAVQPTPILPVISEPANFEISYPETGSISYSTLLSTNQAVSLVLG